MGGDPDPFDRLVARAIRRRFGPAGAYQARTRRLHTARGSVADLAPLRHRLDREPRGRWPAEIERYLDAVARAEAEIGASSVAAFPTVQARLGLRAEPGRPVEGRVTVTAGPDLTLAAAIALDHVTVPVTVGHCRAWGLSPAEVIALAATATGNQPRSRLEHQVAMARPDADGSAPVVGTIVVLTGGPFTSGLVLDPTPLRPPGSRAPSLVAISDDHTLAAVTPAEPGERDLIRWAELLASMVAGSPRTTHPTTTGAPGSPTDRLPTAIWAYHPATGLAMFGIYVSRHDEKTQ